MVDSGQCTHVDVVTAFTMNDIPLSYLTTIRLTLQCISSKRLVTFQRFISADRGDVTNWFVAQYDLRQNQTRVGFD